MVLSVTAQFEQNLGRKYGVVESPHRRREALLEPGVLIHLLDGDPLSRVSPQHPVDKVHAI